MVKSSLRSYYCFLLNDLEYFIKTDCLTFSLCRKGQKTLYSPKLVSHTGSRGDQTAEESEILLVKKIQKKKQPSLFRALCLTFGPYFLISCFYKIIQDILMFTGPEILR